MKNLKVTVLTAPFLLAFLLFPYVTKAQIYDPDKDINYSSNASIEKELNEAQKQLIALLKKEVERLQIEVKIRDLQSQLVGLLNKQVAILQTQLAARLIIK